MSDASDHFHDAEKLARKHRAEGLREAAKIAVNEAVPECKCERCYAALSLAKTYKSRASAIERGEA
jgi:hypothetical protein